MPIEAELSDGEVVEAVLDGRKELYRLLIHRYQNPIFRHASRMLKDEDAADDVVQQAFVKGYKQLASCREPEKVGGWLFRIASNLCKDYLKARRRRNVSLQDGPTLVSERGDPEETLERAELRARLEEALDLLTPDQREAFLLKHAEERSYDEMSELLGASVSALKMRVHRAREALQEILEEEL